MMKENNENYTSSSKDIYQNDDAMLIEPQEKDLENTMDLNKELEKYSKLNIGDKNE